MTVSIVAAIAAVARIAFWAVFVWQLAAWQHGRAHPLIEAALSLVGRIIYAVVVLTLYGLVILGWARFVLAVLRCGLG